MTLERLGRDMVELVPELACFVPPAEVIDKRVYSPWFDTDLHERLQSRGGRVGGAVSCRRGRGSSSG